MSTRRSGTISTYQHMGRFIAITQPRDQIRVCIRLATRRLSIFAYKLSSSEIMNAPSASTADECIRSNSSAVVATNE